MTDYLSVVLDELVPECVDEEGDWGRVVADAGGETPAMTAEEWALDGASTSTVSRERRSRSQRRWLTRRRLVVIGLSAALAALLVTPAFGIGGRLLDLIEDEPARRPEVRISSWSLDGRRIAFVSRRDRGNWELSVVNADGSGQQKLASVAGNATPAWSPDGRRVAFEGPRDGEHDGLYVMNADGSGQRKLARRAHAPAWSPDGRRIAFIWGHKLYVMNADGTERRTVQKSHGGGSLRWSPDGRKLVFLSAGEGCNTCFTFHVVNTDGSAPQSMSVGVAGARERSHWWEQAPVSDPSWSPDGRRIAFARLNDHGGIYVVNADLSGLRRLARTSSGSYAAPAWSPDGGKIAFGFDRDDNSEVFVMKADGSGLRNLTRNPASDADPSWSLDGRKLAFVSDRDGDLDVYVMNADGGGQRRLTRLK